MRQTTIILIILIMTIIILILNAWLPRTTIFGKVLWKGSNKAISNRLVALTFDDGPGEETNELLDLLKSKNVSATFFLVGDRINSNEKILVREVNEGHELGVHTMTHPFLFHKNNELVVEKDLIEKTLLDNEINYSVSFFRPPYGFRTPKTLSIAKSLNLTTVLWNVFPRDYSADNSDLIVKRVIGKTKPGSIICLHDGPNNRKNTLEAVGIIIDELRSEGYEFVSLDELNN